MSRIAAKLLSLAVLGYAAPCSQWPIAPRVTCSRSLKTCCVRPRALRARLMRFEIASVEEGIYQRLALVRSQEYDNFEVYK